MKIKTLVDVTCNEKDKALPYFGKVIGEITSIAIDYINDEKEYQFNFVYKKESGEYLMSGSKIYSSLEINTFYDAIKNDLPEYINWTTDRQIEFYTAFKIEMSDTFGITFEDIETI